MKVINTTRVNPDTGKHYIGERLELNDPRAYANSLHFLGRTPTQAETDEFIEESKVNGYLTESGGMWIWGDDSAPVLYEFGLRWDAIKDLQPVEESAEDTLRALWTAKGISEERQNEILADIESKAKPETLAGMFPQVWTPEGMQYTFTAPGEPIQPALF